jgi:hypothetical protein
MQRLDTISREIGHSLFEVSLPALAAKRLRQEPDDIRGLAAHIRHETDHLRRHLGTGYGLFYHYLNSALPPYFFDWCSAIIRKESSLKFPLLTGAHVVKLRLGKFQEMIENDEELAALAWSATLDLIRLLDGDKCLTPHQVPAMHMITILSELASRPEVPYRASNLELNPYPEDPSLSSFIAFGEPYSPQLMGKKFGAKHLLEALAFTSEQSFGLLSGRQSDVWNDFIGMTDYTLITTFWKLFFGDSAYLKNQLDPDTNDLHIPDEISVHIWPLELAAALDLALWIPIGPYGLMSNGRSLYWEDIHPDGDFSKFALILRQKVSHLFKYRKL